MFACTRGKLFLLGPENRDVPVKRYSGKCCAEYATANKHKLDLTYLLWNCLHWYDITSGARDFAKRCATISNVGSWLMFSIFW